jgi:tryptophan synthase alpha chain
MVYTKYVNRLEERFGELKREGRSAFIAFVTAGFPDLKTTERLLPELERKGVDIVELGIPFSDPLADGPLIQNASAAALKKGASLAAIFAMVRRVRARTRMPLCFMTYYNPVFVMGEERFVKECARSGVDGVIVPDLPMEESCGLSRALRRAGVHLIPFVSPTTSAARLRKICAGGRGFIYYVSLSGVTGPRQRLPKDLEQRVRRVKSLTRTPVCVGFGVSSPEQVRSLSRFSDGVIVGSAIIREIGARAGDPALTTRVAGFCGRLASATRKA